MNFCCRDYNPKAGFASHNPVVSKQTCKDRSKGFRIQRIVSFLFQNCQFFQRGVAYEYNKSIQSMRSRQRHWRLEGGRCMGIGVKTLIKNKRLEQRRSWKNKVNNKINNKNKQQNKQ